MLPMLRRRSPQVDNPLELVRRDFDALRQDLSQVFGNWFPETLAENDLTASYPVDIREENGKIYVDAELPGFDKKDIEVSVENGVLNISAERKEVQEKGKKHLHERRYTKVERQFVLPSDVDESKASGKFENGVLHLELTTTAPSKTKKISIS